MEIINLENSVSVKTKTKAMTNRANTIPVV